MSQPCTGNRSPLFPDFYLHSSMSNYTRSNFTVEEDEAIEKAADVLTKSPRGKLTSSYTMEGLLKSLFSLPDAESIREIVQKTIRQELAGLDVTHIPGTTTLRNSDLISLINIAWRCDHESRPSEATLQALLARNQERVKKGQLPVSFRDLICGGRCYNSSTTFEDFLFYESMIDQFAAFNQEHPGGLQTVRVRFLQDIQNTSEEHDVVFVERGGNIAEILYW